MVETSLLRFGHISMQAQDPPQQRAKDAKKAMELVVERELVALTGTEGHEISFRAAARFHAARLNLRFIEYKSNWIAVNRRFIQRGTFKGWGETIIKNDEVVGKMHDPSLTYASFVVPEIGLITQTVSHYPRFGRPSSKDPDYHRNLQANRKISKFIGDAAREHGAGNKIFLYNGDQNILDNQDDTFFGQPLTSIQDELKKYPGTGHGPIDVFASYDRDGRVSAHSIRVFSDLQQFFFSDHLWMEGTWAVKHLS